MNYEQLKKDTHAIYLTGEIPQWVAIYVMGLKPSKRWITTKFHLVIQFIVKKILEDIRNDSQKEAR
jgi:hypothetical protein